MVTMIEDREPIFIGAGESMPHFAARKLSRIRKKEVVEKASRDGLVLMRMHQLPS
jgi:hypothetical protein